ncbi:MAG: NlpC/P60 family protein [Nocardioidaceae bacterium]
MAGQELHGNPDVFEVRVPVATLWTEPDAPRDVDALAVLDDPDMSGWAAAMDAQARKGLYGRTLTQLLMGEAVRVVEERGDWVCVVALLQPSSGDDGGYPGWLRRAHLGAPVRRTLGASGFVITRSAVCQVEGGGKLELSFGTGLWLDSVESDTAMVLLPDDRRAVISLENVRLSHKKQQQLYGPDDVLDTARQFLGLRYLWGGTSSWGLDCSGLVHLTYRAHGVVVARDAFDQAALAEPVPLDEVSPGDLYFFARPGQRIYHVGFVTRRFGADGIRWMLHAPESGEFIEEAPLAPHRDETLVSAGRVRKPDAGQIARHPNDI